MAFDYHKVPILTQPYEGFRAYSHLKPYLRLGDDHLRKPSGDDQGWGNDSSLSKLKSLKLI